MVKRRRGGDDRKTTQRSRALKMLEKSDDVEFPAVEATGTALPPKEAKMLKTGIAEREAELDALRASRNVSARSPSPMLAGRRKTRRRRRITRRR